jgi:membrane-associated phospholipid phosphatase
MNGSTKGKKLSNRVILLIAGVLLAGMILCFIFADKPAFSRLSQNPPDLHNYGWIRAIKQLGKAYQVLWLLFFWVMVTGRHKTVLVSILAMLITAPVVWTIKATVQRPRPRDIIKAQANIENKSNLPHKWSFPSADTASVFAAGTVLASSAWWPWTIGIAICCGGVGILRVAVLSHYPSDVFAGGAIGILCGWAAIRIIKKKPQIENILGGLERKISFIGVFLAPFLIWFFLGIDKLMILLEFYVPIAVTFFVIGRIRMSQKQNRL